MKAEPAQRRVVLDTKVWLSAALSPQGAPAQVVRAVLLQGLTVFSDATYAELAHLAAKHETPAED